MFENKGIAAISLPSDKTGSIVRFVSAKVQFYLFQKWKKSMLSNLI